MVRITTRTYLHLTPEIVNIGVDLPFYARVAEFDQDTVVFRGFEGEDGSLARAVAEKHVVLASEVNRAGRISLLRRPVAVRVDEQVHYGQVVEVANAQVTVESDGHRFAVRSRAVSVVAPVVALLLEHTVFNRDEWSADDIDTIEESIMNRVLGNGTTVGTNKISAIFEGLMSAENLPDPARRCQWIDPMSGVDVDFPLQHAIDFAFYVDGGVSPVPQTVGESFCRPGVVQQAPNSSTPSRGSVQEVQKLFDPFVDDDETEQAEFEQARNGLSPLPTQVSSSKRPYAQIADTSADVCLQRNPIRRRVALNKDALIVERLGDDPDLLDHFLSLRKAPSAESSVKERVYQVEQRLNVTAKTSPPKKTAVYSKYSFAPSEDQVRIHNRITSEKHRGKSSTLFCKSLVRSDYAKFKALPGVCTRVHDIRFGSGGLSIRHFARLSRDERVSWLQSGGSNFDNLSASAEFSAALPATTVGEVVDSVRVFHSYTREFCCSELVELVEEIIKFLEETLQQVSWSPTELSSLVYWVNDVLEEFRDTVETDGDLGSISKRCSTEDRLLRDLMFVKVHRQVDSIRQEAIIGSTRASHHASRHHNPQGTVHEGRKNLGRIPKDVLRQLPAQVDSGSGKSRNLCMRYISRAGCAVGSDGRCPNDLAHFVPNSLPEVVKTEIIKRFGGLKNEHMNL